MRKLILTLSVLCLSTSAFAGDVYDRVTKNGEIQCGYGIWNPIIYKDINSNEVKGAARDIMVAIGNKTELKINWKEESPWGTIIEGLATHRYDMICTSIGIMSARAKVVDFSTPIFYLPIYIISRKDDKRFDHPEPTINSPDIKIGVLEGEGTSIIAREQYPKAKTISIPQTSDYSLLLEDLKTKKSDVTFVSAETFDAFNKKNPGLLKITAGGKPLSVVRIGFGLPKGDTDFKVLIDTALANLQDEGTLDKILDQYDPNRNLFLRPVRAYEMPK